MPAKKTALTNAPVLAPRQVEGREGALTYRWMKVLDALAAQCSDNPKLHAIGDIALSILENGFIDSPKWDENLNHGQGGIIYGNGRLEALALLEQLYRSGQKLHLPGGAKDVFKPRGVATEIGTGAWVVQVAFGVDSDSHAQALRLLIDHNNLTMAGGNFRTLDFAGLYNSERYLDVLGKIEGALGAEGDDRLIEGGQLTLTVDSSDYALLCKVAADGDSTLQEDWGDAPGEDQDSESQLEDTLPKATTQDGTLVSPVLKLKYPPEQLAEVQGLISRLAPQLGATNPADCVLKALQEVDAYSARPVEAVEA